MNTRYINTDIDLVAPYDLSPLATVLEAKGIWPLHITQQEDSRWCATFECITFETDKDQNTPETTIAEMLDVIEMLQGDAQRLWSGCTVREFNIGYDCGKEPFSFTNELTNTALLRMAKVGAGLRITLYGSSTDSTPEPDTRPK